jgi:hypothetical protein
MLEFTLPLPIVMWEGQNNKEPSNKSIHLKRLITPSCHYHSTDDFVDFSANV